MPTILIYRKAAHEHQTTISRYYVKRPTTQQPTSCAALRTTCATSQTRFLKEVTADHRLDCPAASCTDLKRATTPPPLALQLLLGLRSCRAHFTDAKSAIFSYCNPSTGNTSVSHLGSRRHSCAAPKLSNHTAANNLPTNQHAVRPLLDSAYPTSLRLAHPDFPPRHATSARSPGA